MRENLPKLPSVKVAVGLGGSLDVWAGRVRRAPQLLQRCGMEWAWRMAVQPHRLKQLPKMLHFVRGIKPEPNSKKERQGTV